MRTYTHGLIGYLIYLKGTVQERKLAVLGSITPDLILILGFIFNVFGNSSNVQYFHRLFHSSILQTITEYMHSILIVIFLMIISWFLYKKAFPFLVGMLSHNIIDLLTHQKWAYNHFLPLKVEPIMGMVSYTSTWFTILEHLFVVIFIIWFFRKKNKKKKK